MEFNSLNDDCFLLIFNEFTVQELLELKAVCKKWLDMVIKACRQRTEITILIGRQNPADLINQSPLMANQYVSSSGKVVSCISQPVSAFKQNQLEYLSLTRKEVKWLCEHFPIVTTLQVSQSIVPSRVLKQVINLIKFWSPRLRSLKLWIQFKDGKDLSLMLNALNTLPALKHLTLESCGFKTIMSDNNYNYDLTVLKQLEEFNFVADLDASLLYDSLINYAMPNKKLRKISLNHLNFGRFEIEQLLQVKPKPFIELDIARYNIQLPKFKTICKHFTSLTTIWISTRNLGLENSLTSLWSDLASLPQLATLHLDISSFVLSTRNQANQNQQTRGQVLRTLPSLRVLDLKCSSLNAHLDLRFFRLAVVMPNLAVFALTFDNIEKYCSTCKNLLCMQPFGLVCIDKMLNPLKACNKLERIYMKRGSLYTHQWFVSQL